ncbi:hypothetical protein [Pelagibacterium lentulum]|uniref:Uncharacterized protein n=1 Tax=Pelagibacterium lentulum TaxID=2029865 RepID=A0A916RP23_9HYPH|nr:hypothetical protein [Pelagibacterium lentulum]GGA62425.1 hypothetical protein GCM10011499_35990 [Pelagibacterium lentulum]
MTSEAPAFDYSAPAELFTGKRYRRLGKIHYQRFESAAQAIQYAVEAMPRENLAGAVLEIDEQRFGPAEITALYKHPAYPLN